MNFLIIFILMLFSIAFLFSLPVLLPPLRRWARSGFDARGIVVLIFAGLTLLLTIAIFFIVMTYVSTIVMVNKFWSADAGQSDLITEIWRRQVIPAPFSRSCYTAETICNLVDARVPLLGFDSISLRFGIIPGLITASINIFLVSWFTRPTPYKGGTTGRMMWEE
jgi:hypothetical protein